MLHCNGHNIDITIFLLEEDVNPGKNEEEEILQQAIAMSLEEEKNTGISVYSFINIYVKFDFVRIQKQSSNCVYFNFFHLKHP